MASINRNLAFLWCMLAIAVMAFCSCTIGLSEAYADDEADLQVSGIENADGENSQPSNSFAGLSSDNDKSNESLSIDSINKDADDPVESAVENPEQTEPISAEISTQNAIVEEELLTQEATPEVVLKAEAHVQNKGWIAAKTITAEGTQIGTTGSGLRLEALKFTFSSGISGTIQCQAHVESIGWQSILNAGSVVGTTGKALRVEAIRLALTGELSQWYDLKYKAHVQNKGWMDWVSNGAIAGTSGQGLRLEALDLMLVPKTTKAAQTSDGIIGVRASAHVQNIGWQNDVNTGETIGTTGRSLRVEALRMTLDAGTIGGGIQMNAHVQNIGWQGYRSGVAGTTGQALRMEAIQLRLTNNIVNSYDVIYRAHVQDIGWQPWVANGGTAGTTGQAKRIEALQVKLVNKHTGQTVSEGTYFLSLASDASKALASSGGSGAQVATSAYAVNSMNERYYVRNENGGITLQSVATGMFLEASGVSVIQKAYVASNNAQTWTLAWNGGYALTNKATGKSLLLSGNKAATGSAQHWMLTSTSLIPDGNYVVANSAAGKVLDVSNASWASGANIMVFDANGGGNQAFSFVHTGGNTYKIICAMTGKAVDVAGGSSNDGANVRQWATNGSNAQLWKASIDRAGKLTFINRASGKALTAEKSGAAGANVCSSANANTATQKWTLKASSYQSDSVLQRAVSIANGLSSATSYFIAVDLSNHRVVVMQGSVGNWAPIQNWTVSTGAPSTPTVVGDYTIGSRGYSFGSGYTCYYWTQFYGDYLFHSVLYNQGTFDIQDGRLGYSISHGCVRMNIDHAKWIYDVIPSGTHVRTYY